MAMSEALVIKLFIYVAVFGYASCNDQRPVKYYRHLSELRRDELNYIGHQVELSVNPDKDPCNHYYDYVCSRYRPLYSVMGHLPNITQIMQLMTELQTDRGNFEAKQKLNDFFVSCNTVKHVEDCYRETFEYFKPIFAYVITKYHIDSSSHEHYDFLDVLGKFLDKAEITENFSRSYVRARLVALKEKFRRPQVYFRADELNLEYKDLRIYRESYEHNIKNLDRHRRRHTTFDEGIPRNMLDWTMYVYQSRNKPRSYYYATLNVHLWMTLYNATVREFEPRRLQSMAQCLSLPENINILEEARILAVVYLKSFRKAWEDYVEWMNEGDFKVNLETHDQENAVLKQHNHLNNKSLFFVLYAQNFCDFGNEIAQHVFYLGLKQSADFEHLYHCQKSLQPREECVPY